MSGNKACFDWLFALVKQGSLNFNIDSYNLDGETCLMLAVKSRNEALLKTILNAPVAANPFYRDIFGRSALDCAIEMNNDSAMQLISISYRQWLEF